MGGLFRAFWDPSAPALQEYLDRNALMDTKENRLHWMLCHTLGCPSTFEHRRTELAEIQGAVCSSITNEEVVQSFVDSVEDEEGAVTAYLRHAQLAAVVGDTLYVHGAAEPSALGFIPGLDTRFAQNTDEDLQKAGLREGLPLHEWVAELNTFAQKSWFDWRTRPRWDDGGRRGGEALMAYQCRPSMQLRTVTVTCYVDGLNMPSREAMEDLKEGFPNCSDPAS